MISFNISIVPWAVNAAAMSLSRPKLPKVPEPTGDVRTLSEPDEDFTNIDFFGFFSKDFSSLALICASLVRSGDADAY